MEHLGKHSSSQFNKEMASIRSHLLRMGGLVEQQMRDGLDAFTHDDLDLARRVIKNEDEVNRLEMLIDEECARVLALRQPAAIDLRTIIAVSKCASDLERIGDELDKIARLTLDLQSEGNAPMGYIEVRTIGTKVSNMLNAALDSFARFDANKAVSVAATDDIIDADYQSAMRSLITVMMEDPRSITRILIIMWMLRSLERIGDHSRNICEQVVYLVKGKDVRHLSIEQMAQALKKQ